MVSKPAATPKLVIIEGKDKGKVISLQDGTVIIGRFKGDVLIQDARVSRSHTSVKFDSRTGKVSFADLKSLNGTLVNGNPAEAGELHDGDKLQLGNTLFDCQISNSGSEEDASLKEHTEARGTQNTVERPEPEVISLASRPSRPARNRERDRAPEPEHELEHEHQHESQQAEPEEEFAPAPKARYNPNPKSSSRDKDTENDFFEDEDHDESPVKHRVAALKAAYLKLPQRTRRIALVILLAVGLVSVFGKGKPTKEFWDHEMTGIRKLEEQGKVSEAMVKAEQLKSDYPEYSVPYMAIGELAAAQGKNDVAISAYLKAEELKPPQPLVHTRLLRLYLQNGMSPEAEGELKLVDDQIKDGPQTKEVFVDAARLFLEFKELKQPPEKTIILARALQNSIAPESTVGYILEARTLFQINRPQDAITVMEKGLKVDSQDDWLLENMVFAPTRDEGCRRGLQSGRDVDKDEARIHQGASGDGVSEIQHARSERGHSVSDQATRCLSEPAERTSSP